MAWELTGNEGTANSFLGTTNNQPMVVKTNGKERLRVDADGNVTLVAEPRVVLMGAPAVTTLSVHGDLKITDGPAPSGAPSVAKVVRAGIEVSGAAPSLAIRRESSGTKKDLMSLTSDGTLHVGPVILDGTTGTVIAQRLDCGATVIDRATSTFNVGRVGIDGAAGKLTLKDQTGADTFAIDGQYRLLLLKNEAGTDTIVLASAPLDQSGNPVGAAITLRNKDHKDCVWIHADSSNGGSGIHLSDQTGAPTIQIDGDKGDIYLLNADCAEDFEVADVRLAEPGTVMVLNEDAQLVPSSRPYDTRVAGVVSGARDLRPGLILGRELRLSAHSPKLPIALVGRAYAKVDATYGPIAIGDLLTTSPTPGHAMKAGDAARSFGAIIGKAMRSIAQGADLIPILIALQ